MQFIKSIIDQAGVKDKLIIAGHSRGSVDAILIAEKLKVLDLYILIHFLFF